MFTDRCPYHVERLVLAERAYWLPLHLTVTLCVLGTAGTYAALGMWAHCWLSMGSAGLAGGMAWLAWRARRRLRASGPVKSCSCGGCKGTDPSTHGSCSRRGRFLRLDDDEWGRHGG